MINLLQLPSEVLDLVCSFSRTALKDLRLATSRISDASTPHLFRSITLVPHWNSFANLLALARSPLARHVHDIAYDVRVLSAISDIKMSFEANEFFLVGTNIDVSRKKIFALLDDYEKHAFNAVEKTDIEIRHLLGILPLLPNLEHITVTSGSLCDLPYFYKKLKESLCITSDYYFETSHHTGHHARSVMLCLGALKNRKMPGLSFYGIDWEEVMLFTELRDPTRYVNTLQHVFRRLSKRDLTLPMYHFCYATKQIEISAAMDGLLPVVATIFDNVPHLTLSLATSQVERQLFLPTGPRVPNDTGSAWLPWIWDWMRPNWVRPMTPVVPSILQRLTLSSLILDPEGVERFMGGCRTSLTSLSMCDIRLGTARKLGPVDSDDEGCWVEVLESISRSTPNVTNVRLFGRFYNGCSQDWTLGVGGKGALRTDVERWMVEGGTCPLDSERIAGGLQGLRIGDTSFKIRRRILDDDDGAWDFPPTSENELVGAW